MSTDSLKSSVKNVAIEDSVNNPTAPEETDKAEKEDTGIVSFGSDEESDLKKDTTFPTKNMSLMESRKMVQDGKLRVLDVPMREFSFSPGCIKDHISFNPLTSLIGVVVLWGLSIWCMVDPHGSKDQLMMARSNVTLYFTWLIIVQKPIAFFFAIFIAYKFGHVKFGEKDEKPEFNGMQFFSMIFAAGVAVGIFYYGVAEPLYHQTGHWFAEAGYRSQDEIDQMAMTYTLFHWGFDAWSVYILVAVSTALAAYRFKLPLTFRSCFYPIFGEYTWGWLGDLIDGFSIVVTVSGVCTSLGLGAIQMTAGFQRLGWVDQELSAQETANIQTILIWCITGIATASVISGLDVGIKYLSMFAFGLGILLTIMVLVLENTSYILNLQVQSIGSYFQWAIFQVNFNTDAFGQLRAGEGRAVDGNAADPGWLDAWTIFYWNWWTSWACFVGLFVARISRGRTVGELIIYSLGAPFIYCLFWFCIWGGAGLRQARQALELQVLGKEYYNNTDFFQNTANEYCYDVPQEDLYENGTLIFHNYHKGITPVCVLESTDASSFNLLYSFSYPDVWENGMGPTLTVLYLFAIAVYFCTSSDSGSLVVDFLASNGRHEHHWLQRLFWALTEGAVATALLNAGGADGLAALQAASIISGLPFTIFLLYLMQTIYEFCSQALDEDQKFYEIKDRKEFRMPVYGGIFNAMEQVASLGDVHEERVAIGIDRADKTHVMAFLQGLFIPFVALNEITSKFYPASSQKTPNRITVGVYTIMHLAWIALFISVVKYPALRAWGWCAFFVNGCLLTSLKADYRDRNSIHGNIIGDFFSATFIFPQVFAQLLIEVRAEDFISGAPEETEGLLSPSTGEDEEFEDTFKEVAPALETSETKPMGVNEMSA